MNANIVESITNNIKYTRLDINILIVEDDVELRTTLASSLSLLVDKVYQANDGQEAIDIMEENDDIDLIITDMCMPNKDGSDVIEYAIKHKKPFIPIIVTSAYCDELHKFETLDCVTLMRKPVDVGLLYLTMRDMINTQDICVIEKSVQKLADACYDAKKLMEKLNSL